MIRSIVVWGVGLWLAWQVGCFLLLAILH